VGATSNVTGTAPITVASGTTTPVISITAATQAATGSVRLATTAESIAGSSVTIALSPGTGVAKNAATMTGSAYIPAGTTAQQPAANAYTGQLRYNTTIPQWEGSNGISWEPLSSAATLAEAATGTSNTVYSSPQTAVPKDASGMTGAALMPGGTTAQQPGTPVTGMVRYNNQGGTPATTYMEWYDGATWQTAWGAGGGALLNIKVITSSGTYTPTAGTKSVVVYTIGGGGEGGTSYDPFCAATAVAGNGGNGGLSIRGYSSAELGANAACTVGGGGSGGSDGYQGYPGGASSFDPAGTGVTVTAGGGGGGGNCESASIPGSCHPFAGSAGGGSGGQLTVAGGGPIWGYGAGGAGSVSSCSAPVPGGAGAAGAVVIWEYS
jgi:hypothetical protein